MEQRLPLAKITDRFLAFLVDLALFAVGVYAALYVLVVRLERLPNTMAVWNCALLSGLAAYLVYQAAGNLRGATLGKKLFGISVVGRDGAPLSAGRSVLRAFGYLASMPLNLGFLWSLVDRDSRAWHDLLAGSLVVERRPKSPLAALASAALAFGTLVAMAAVNLWWLFAAPSPADQRALEKAREGLRVLAAIQEVYREEHGRYTESLPELARASGDVGQFKEAMAQIFQPNGFVLIVRDDGYELRARAKDRRKTVVSITGPDPSS